MHMPTRRSVQILNSLSVSTILYYKDLNPTSWLISPGPGVIIAESQASILNDYHNNQCAAFPCE